MTTSTLLRFEDAVHTSLRNEPVQARSAARLTALLDAAAAVVAEHGYEQLTTAMVADRADASIGTVYRYFPDRIALLEALAARNLERVLVRVTDEISDEKYSDWASALRGAFAIFVDAFRAEPGFRSLRGGDVIDIRPPHKTRTSNSVVAEAILNALGGRFELIVTDQTRFVFECAIEIADAIAARAFTFSPRGDAEFLDAGQNIVYSMLVEHFGAPDRN